MTSEIFQGINIKGGTNTVTGNTFNSYPPEKPFKPIKYIPKIGSENFVGREDEQALELQKQLLGENHPDTVKSRGDSEDFWGKQGT
ncbi:hypothetical protein NIES267_66780 [Calothrix parasitica NIES-267]|uniref:Uncharacterized protein n=1 Tax=Calothrix parasitica NIES-267 TaxID=1973488 RepID=A0A1Z4M111_9CYAN|nr:hypothetical protein NIES267_66780 [Calothrix parasitica NIES-267]